MPAAAGSDIDNRDRLRVSSTMAQNIYDNPDFFARYSQLPRQVQGLDGAPEWPVLRAMIPDLAGKRVLDLGCGFGWFCRWARQQGAASALGVDLSQSMLARARSATVDPQIEYRAADLESFEPPAASFDFVHSALALHYVRDFGRLAQAMHRALTPGSRFVCTIEHPIFMAPAHPRWEKDEDGRMTWPLNSYNREGPRRTDWLVKGVLKYHRTMATTLNSLIDAGFVLRRLEEYAPTPEQLAGDADLAEEIERPTFLLLALER